MCMIDDTDRSEVWREEIRRARKVYSCGECGRLISIGERHRYIFSVHEGNAEQQRQCEHCMVAADWLCLECTGYCLGGIGEDIEQHCDEYRRMDLWRLFAGMRRKWQRFDGKGLLPLPALPYTSEALAAWELGGPVTYSYQTHRWETMT